MVAKHAELGGHVSPGTPIVDIVSRGQVDARLMVPESVINLIRVDQALPIRVDPLGEEVRGKVVSVTPYGPTASRTFPVRVRLDDQEGRLKVGMSVTAMIATGPGEGGAGRFQGRGAGPARRLHGLGRRAPRRQRRRPRSSPCP